MSFLGFQWKKLDFDERYAAFLRQKFGFSVVLSTLLSQKNISEGDIENFLDPKIKNNLPDPFHLMDMEIAINIIINAIESGKKIMIFGDYDVDGATSSALLKNFFFSIGVKVGIYIPNRFSEGYGPNIEAFRKIKNDGYEIVVTVDCGTVSFEPIREAKEIGLEVIVIDHHLGATEKPKAIAVINPNRLDEKSKYGYLAAVGICFLFIVGLNQKLRKAGFYKNHNEPNLMQFLDLVALGTVCDVMPLVGLNRVFVSQGLKIMALRQNLGIRALIDFAGIKTSPNVYHLGFVIGPRINAGGRIDKSDLGARLLTSRDEREVAVIAENLSNLNSERREIEISLTNEVKKFVKNGAKIAFVSGFDWHIGVIGIVASRLKDLYNVPSVVISIDKNTHIGKASCRSVKGFDIGNAILKAKMEGILLEGGGHAAAGGFSIDEGRVNELEEFLSDLVINNEVSVMELPISDILSVQMVNLKFAKEIEKFGPFGNGNPRPKFVIQNAKIREIIPMGKNGEFLRVIFEDTNYAGTKKAFYLEGVLFNGVDNGLYAKIMSIKGEKIAVAGYVDINEWMGRENVQFIIEDIADF